eukprot:SM000050S17063  [mRNA]  locus=s50:688998:690716:- [translate_table: standard]
MQVSPERLILLDTQPVYSASLMSEAVRPDGTAAAVGEPFSAEVAQELLSLQLGIFLASVCHILLLVSEGCNDVVMWQFYRTVDMLRLNRADPSQRAGRSAAAAAARAKAVQALQQPPPGSGTAQKAPVAEEPDHERARSQDFQPELVFVHTKVQAEDCSLAAMADLQESLNTFFQPFGRAAHTAKTAAPSNGPNQEAVVGKEAAPQRARRSYLGSRGKSGDPATNEGRDVGSQHLFVLPRRGDPNIHLMHQTYETTLRHLTNRVLSRQRCKFAYPMSEREWLKAAAEAWDQVSGSAILADYGRFLQSTAKVKR